MATWKRILVEDDIVGEDPISITDGVVSLIDPSGLNANPENDDTDVLLVYDNTSQEWTSLTLDNLFGYLTALLAQSQIDSGGSTTIFEPGGVLGDLDGDGSVNVNDMLIFFQVYGSSASIAASYYYTNSAVSFTTWSTLEYKKLQIDSTGTASSTVVTISVDAINEEVELSSIPATANVPLNISFTPILFAAWVATFTYRVVLETRDQNNVVMLDDYEWTVGTTEVTAGILFGSEFSPNSPIEATFSPLQLKNNVTSNSAPSQITVYIECLLFTNGQPNADTHKAKIKDLTINYL